MNDTRQIHTYNGRPTGLEVLYHLLNSAIFNYLERSTPNPATPLFDVR